MNSLNHKSNSKLIATLVGALWLTGQASLTLADPPKGAPPVEKSTTVRFADLNLESPEGAHALYSRIRSAAESLCGEQFSLWDGNRSREWQDCYRTTIERAVVQLNRPVLTSVHREAVQGPHPASVMLGSQAPSAHGIDVPTQTAAK
jgi:UrcA family protein